MIPVVGSITSWSELLQAGVNNPEMDPVPHIKRLKLTGHLSESMAESFLLMEFQTRLKEVKAIQFVE